MPSDAWIIITRRELTFIIIIILRAGTRHHGTIPSHLSTQSSKCTNTSDSICMCRPCVAYTIAPSAATVLYIVLLVHL